MADKNKGNMRFQQISTRQNKRVRYDGLTPDQTKYIKAINAKKQADKDMNSFWLYAPRNESGSVDWNAMSEDELDNFEYINKKCESLSKKVLKLEHTGIDIDRTLDFFTQLNCHSVSY